MAGSVSRQSAGSGTALTEAQRDAVEFFEGPLMVLAGPGSGKTRVITHRIARLTDRGVPPDRILALTFTNKAAREMSERVHRLLGGARVAVSTFHRFCSRLLRRWPEAVGLKENFTILDTDDQVRLIRKILKDVDLDPKTYTPRSVLNRISRLRNDLVTAEQFRKSFEERIGDPIDAAVCRVFPEYEQRLLAANGVDFDALLVHVVEMLRQEDGIRELLDDHFRFVLVDEYQDTNFAQYQIVQCISRDYPNLCATGDPDQSIYGWRGARIENLAQFERDFPDTGIVQLDQNFRSTANIVRCADELITQNPRRHARRLTTENPDGDPVVLRIFEDADSEAEGVARDILFQVQEEGCSYSDFAVFYRVNTLSRAFETALTRAGIPYQVAAGFSFYERAEVRDVIGYLRLIENPSDDAAFERIVNRPARGIGKKSIDFLQRFATARGLSLLESAARSDENPGLRPRASKALQGFADLIERMNHLSAQLTVPELIESLLNETAYLSVWKDEFDEVDQDRAGNIHELMNAAAQYEELQQEIGETPSLQGFLEQACLTSEVDDVDGSKGAVTLMTMHASKGLEYPVVYLIGLENGLIPHERAVKNGNPAAYEEERRLLFVGVTRAMKKLVVTQTTRRLLHGRSVTTIASPFAAEMPLTTQLDDGVLIAPRTATEWDRPGREARERYLSLGGSSSALSDMRARLAARMARSSLPHSDEAEPIGKSPGAAPSQVFRTGMQVRHPRYGRGTVTAVSEGVVRATVTVQFESSDETQTFVTAHCPLQPLG